MPARQNELVFRGIMLWARWTAVGTVLAMLRLGGPEVEVALKCAAALALLTGLFVLLAHRPGGLLRTAARVQVVLECLSVGATLAALWPGVPKVLFAVPAVLANVGTGLLWLRCAAALRLELPEVALSLRRAGVAWLLIYGLGSVAVLAVVHARGEGNFQVRTPLAPCLVWMVFAVPVVMGLVGASKLYAALRRPENTCANCRFSLVGLRDPVCPECGAPVRGPLPGPGEGVAEADSVGLRVAVAAVVIAVAGGAGYFQLPANGLAKHKPFWLLRRDTQETTTSPDRWGSFFMSERPRERYPSSGATEAIKELADRIRAASLPPEEIGLLREDALVALEDVALSFDAWVPLVHELRGSWTPEQAQRFDRGCVEFSLELPDSVPAGEAIAMRLVCESRADGIYDFNDELHLFRGASGTFDGKTFTIPQHWGGSRGNRVSRVDLESFALNEAPAWIRAPAQPGSYPIELVATFLGTRNEQRQVRFRGTVVVVAGDTPPSYQVVQNIGQHRLTAGSLRCLLYIGPRGGTLSVHPESGAVRDLNVVADAFAMIGNEEQHLGIVRLEGYRGGYLPLSADAAITLHEQGDTVKIILRPNPPAARRAIGIKKLWDGEDLEVTARVTRSWEWSRPPRPPSKSGDQP